MGDGQGARGESVLKRDKGRLGRKTKSHVVINTLAMYLIRMWTHRDTPFVKNIV